MMTTNCHRFDIIIQYVISTLTSIPFYVAIFILEWIFIVSLALQTYWSAVNHGTPNEYNIVNHPGIFSLIFRHDIHLIVDEIFAMTVHGQDSEFVSILTIPRVMESDRVHMTWGISKVLWKIIVVYWEFSICCVSLCMMLQYFVVSALVWWSIIFELTLYWRQHRVIWNHLGPLILAWINFNPSMDK